MKTSHALTAATVSAVAIASIRIAKRVTSREYQAARIRQAFNQATESFVQQPGEAIRRRLTAADWTSGFRQQLANDPCWREPRTVNLVQKFLDCTLDHNLRHDEIDELLEIVAMARAVSGIAEPMAADIVGICGGHAVNVATLELRLGEQSRQVG